MATGRSLRAGHRARRDRSSSGLRRQHGRAGRTRRVAIEVQLAARAVLPGRRAGRARPGPGLRHRRPRHPRRHVHRAGQHVGAATCEHAARRAGCELLRELGGVRLLRAPVAAAAAGGRGSARAGGTPRPRDQEAISHHYDVSNRFYEWVLGPSMAYTCAVYPTRGRHAGGGAVRQARPGRPQARPAARACGCSTSAAAGAAWSCTRPEHYGVKALGVTLSRQQAEWAQKAIAEAGPHRAGRGPPPGLPRRRRDRLRRGQLDRADRAHRQGAAARRTSSSCTTSCGRAAGCSTTASPGRTTTSRRQRERLHQPVRLPRRRAGGPGHLVSADARHRLRGAARGEPARALRA